MTGFDRLVTTAEAAKQLNVDRSVIVRAVLDGRLACEHKLPGRTGSYLFHQADLARFAEQRQKAS
jgi:excisionase family DNA binding protein